MCAVTNVAYMWLLFPSAQSVILNCNNSIGDREYKGAYENGQNIYMFLI